ncbi:hypothetical protein [Salinispora arenicola]|uniref:Uncharacterized protein n=1 Tax=Salinispora arenicola (strain CNS-205) TaxID=391037 RepID=A8LZK1_SALAI|nr:hypothetical protein [Salinispora arenicola]NIL58885.1 hypothetical protein [Salinispora arenicola]NIL60694.1 hypothetical protein [Salinispora arenicola]
MVLSGKLWFGRLRRTVGLTLAVALLGAAFGAAPARANTTDGLIVNLSVNYSGFTTGFYPESGWRVKDGPDGVAVAFPQEWGYTYGPDGRIAAYPRSSGWRVKDGPDGRAIAFPQEWNYTYGGDGRLVPYPRSGWRIDERSDDRRIAFPDEWFTWGQIIPSPASGDLSLMFPSASSQALLMAAEASLTPEEFSNYLIVQYIQQVIVGRD